MSDEISEDNQIQAYLHCALCLTEFAKKVDADGNKINTRGQSPQTYARLSIGWTKKGFQAWCFRHKANVLNVDFEGHTHPATTNRKKKWELGN